MASRAVPKGAGGPRQSTAETTALNIPAALGRVVGGGNSKGQLTLIKFPPLLEKGQLTWKFNQLLKTKDFSLSCTSV